MKTANLPQIICITGGIGSGKSTIAKYIESKGYLVYNSDFEAKKISESKEVIKAIRTEISDKVFINNKLDRKLLAQLVFNDKDQLQKLNQIIHPLVKAHFENWLIQNHNQRLLFKESALVFEIGLNNSCDEIISVIAPKAARIERVMRRDHLTKKDVLNRIKNQVNDAARRKLSSFCIFNKDLSKAYRKTDQILKILEKR